MSLIAKREVWTVDWEVVCKNPIASEDRVSSGSQSLANTWSIGVKATCCGRMIAGDYQEFDHEPGWEEAAITAVRLAREIQQRLPLHSPKDWKP